MTSTTFAWQCKAAVLILVLVPGAIAKPRKVRIPLSTLYVNVPRDSKPRFWANAVEFDHKGWQEICLAANGAVQCIPLKQPSPMK